MTDLLITKGRHRAFVWATTKLGEEWIRKTFPASEILVGGIQIGVSFNADVVEDMTVTLDMEEEVTYEVR